MGSLYRNKITMANSGMLGEQSLSDEITRPRPDIYTMVFERAKEMAAHDGVPFDKAEYDRSFLKKTVLMPSLYGSTACWRRLPEVESSYVKAAAHELMPGVFMHQNMCSKLDMTGKTEVRWTCPISGAERGYSNRETEIRKIKTDTGETFPIGVSVPAQSRRNIAIAANTIHSLDAAVVAHVRSTITGLGLPFRDVHDEFSSVPGGINAIRVEYKRKMLDLLLNDYEVLAELSGKPIAFNKARPQAEFIVEELVAGVLNAEQFLI